MHECQRRSFHYPDVMQRGCFVVYPVSTHQPGQAVVIQTGRPAHPHAPLRAGRLKDVEGRPNVRPDIDNDLFEVIRSQPQTGQLFSSGIWLIERRGNRY